MIKRGYRMIAVLLAAILIVFGLTACKKKVETPDPAPDTAEVEAEADADSSGDAEADTDTDADPNSDSGSEAAADLSEDGYYYSKEDVALYLHIYGHLPDNFITKKEARKLGWSGGSVEKYAPDKAIGGDVFGNYEGNLPDDKGQTYHECDIDTKGRSKRGAKRIVWSDDGNIYYTEDHYETFELLYGSD